MGRNVGQITVFSVGKVMTCSRETLGDTEGTATECLFLVVSIFYMQHVVMFKIDPNTVLCSKR